jgi:hypothetical protein
MAEYIQAVVSFYRSVTTVEIIQQRLHVKNNMIGAMEELVENFDLQFEAVRQDEQLLEDQDVASRLRRQAAQRDLRADMRESRDVRRKLAVEVLERNRLLQEMEHWVRTRDRLEQELEFMEEVEQRRGLSQEQVEAATEGRDAASGEEVDCRICLAPMVPGEAVLALRRCACRRAFHAACLARWLAGSSSCPLCRGQAPGPLKLGNQEQGSRAT